MPATMLAQPVALNDARPADPATRQRLVASYGKLPLSFEINKGQTAKEVRFLSRGSGYSLFLTPTEAVLSLKSPQRHKEHRENRMSQSPRPQRLGGEAAKPAVLRMKLVGANTNPHVSGMDELPGKSNYFIGSDPQKWRTNVSHYAKVRYQGVYPGIDLIYYGNQRQLEYDFIVAPGANPSRIRMSFTGAGKVEINKKGELVLHTAGGKVIQHAPIIYQEINSRRQSVAGHYVLKGKNQVGFRLADYDRTKPLVVDPVLVYSTYLGGSSHESAGGIAVDSAGNTYLTGGTSSTNFPTRNSIQAASGGDSDAFVCKLNASGSALIYSTYLGGSSLDGGGGIAVDSAGNTYLTGDTSSTNFPTRNPLQTAFGGNGDTFVCKLNVSGSALIYSTYLGGSGGEWSAGIAGDSAGNAYLTGVTSSTDFPTRNPIQATYGGGDWDAFVCKLNANGSALVYSTYLGGSGYEVAGGIAVDSVGSVYLTGITNSTDFPTRNPLQAAFGGGLNGDAFMCKLNASGSALVYSTYLGGSGDDGAWGIAVDSSGNAYLTGRTDSTDFPTVNPLQAASGGGECDAFVCKLNASGSALIYSTYLGGSDREFGDGIVVDSAGNTYLKGYTDSTDFPTVNPLQAASGGNGDAFVCKLNASGSTLIYSTYLGGSYFDGVDGGITVDSAGSVYLMGSTLSVDFPTKNALQPTNHGELVWDATVTKISDGTPTPTPTPPAPDTIPPWVVITTPPNGATISSFSSIAGTASDNAGGSGVSRVDLYMQHMNSGDLWTNAGWSTVETALATTLSGTPWSRSSGLPSGTNLRSGLYQLIAYAYDRAGNPSRAASATVTVSTTPVRSKRKLVLIKGTWNATIYDNLKARLKDKAGYIDEDFIDFNLSEDGKADMMLCSTDPVTGTHCTPPHNGGDARIEVSVRDLRKLLMDRGIKGNPLSHIDIIAHSAGGLVARQFINEDGAAGSVKLCIVDNLITLATPYGGIKGCEDPISQVVGGDIISDMQMDQTFGNTKYGPLVYKNTVLPWVDDTHTFFGKQGDTTYWGLGGAKSLNWDGLYAAAFFSEPKLYDGLVNIQSAYGRRPERSILAKCEENFRIFGPLNHSDVPQSDMVIDDYIIPALAGKAWSNCHSILPAAVAVDEPQLIDLKKLLLSQNVSQTFTVPVDSCREASFSLISFATCDFTLEKPDGTLITSAVSDPNIVYADTGVAGIHAYSFTIANPPVGSWKVKMTPTVVPTNGNAATLTISVTNSLSLTGAVETTEYANGSTPRLLATLTENGNPRTGATVVASATNSAGTTFTQTLLDDGAHNDGAANNGIYGGQLPALTTGGIYHVNFKATGTNAAAQQFQRVASSFFTVAPANANLTKSYAEYALDTDADGVLEFLQINVGVNVKKASNYLVEGTLKDSTGAVIDTVLGSAKNLTYGVRNIALLFNGSTILKHGKPGPYRLTNVRLFSETDGRPIWIETDSTGYTTKAYTLAQFDHPPKVQVLQPNASNPLADKFFNVVLQATDEDNPATVAVYYDTDKVGFNGRLIASGLTAGGQRVVTWDTSVVPGGNYYIYAIAADGVRAPVGAYSAGYVRIKTPPVAVSIAPGNSSHVVSVSRTYTAKYADANGIPDITEARILINSTQNGAGALHGLYLVGSNRLYLRDNANGTWLGGFAPLSNNVISNSQGSLNCALTSVGGNGNTLTVNWNFTPANTFMGGKYIYMQVRDKTNLVDGWKQMGTVQIVANKAPINHSVLPSSGSSAAGAARLLAAKYYDENGSSDVAEARILVNSVASGSGALMGMYTPANNKLFLRDNTNGSWLGGFAPGSNNVITNSQGSLNCAATTVTFGAQILTINWSFTPATTFTGTKNLYLLVRDRSNAVDGLEPLGTWSITGSTSTARAATSPVVLSTGVARVAGDSIHLTFTGALDAAVVGEAARYRVEVSGAAVAVAHAAYNAGTHSVTLSLPAGSLQAGDAVRVSWQDLKDAAGATLSGQTGALTAR